MEGEKAEDLLRKYREGTLTETERALLESWYLREAREKGLTADKDTIGEYLENLNPPGLSVRPGILLRRISWAAGIVMILSVAAYRWLQREPSPVSQAVLQKDALPGEQRARLVLASGENILLDEVSSGKLAQEGPVSIVKTAEGELVYHADSRKGAALSNYNTIETPKAGQYQVKLSDGTRVWLNAASSIRFPPGFSDRERVVEATGEVYFEVAKAESGGRRIPFKVVSGDQETEVLGTRFNINSYADEGVIRTTLLEGSIQVRTPGKGIVLQPGQQAQMTSGQPLKVSRVNTGQVMAWKEGYFRFDGVGLKELMRQLSRWYDMEVVYEGNIHDHEFVGEISR
ncbi:MAG: FecR domain-containing protein, partial [Leadbetterella sp.]|nr:FecR domain-containing protein [Leadbetterella sp.]